MKSEDRTYIVPKELDVVVKWYKLRKTYLCSQFKSRFEKAKAVGDLTKIVGDLNWLDGTYVEIRSFVKSIDQIYDKYGVYGKCAGIIESPKGLKGIKIALSRDSLS